MHRLHMRTKAEELQYHLDDGRATDFTTGQPGRVELAKTYLAKILEGLGPGRHRIVELGCGAGDISGPFSSDHHVVGVDIVPAAQVACEERWPEMHFFLDDIEYSGIWNYADVVVLCETLEHIHDPIGLVERWLSASKAALIGHPLVGCGPDPERGHIWGFHDDDFRAWWRIGGMTPMEAVEFEMGPYRRMVMGWGVRE